MVDPVLAIVADDLSGAAESAAHAVLRVSRSIVALTTTAKTTSALVVSIDTDSRAATPEQARAAARAAAETVRAVPVVVKKVDSLLRGHVGLEVDALATTLGRHPVVTVANPALQRVVRRGVLHVGTTPLHESNLWAVEGAPPPHDVAQALAPARCVVIPLAIVRSGVEQLAAALADAQRRGLVATCDAETVADLDAVVAAAAHGGSPSLLVGSGALVAAAVRSLDGALLASDPAGEPGTPAPVASLLAVLGSRAPGIAAQIAHAAGSASATYMLTPDELLSTPDDVAVTLHGAPRSGLVVVAVDPDAPVDPTRSRRLAAALGTAVSPLVDRYDATFLSGGETARTVLDLLGVASLEVVAALDPGTVLSRRPDGRLVVTRPGSFGDERSLARAAHQLLVPHRTSPTTEENS